MKKKPEFYYLRYAGILFTAIVVIGILPEIETIYDLWKYTRKDRYIHLKKRIESQPDKHTIKFTDGTWIRLCHYSTPYTASAASVEVIQTMDNDWFDVQGNEIYDCVWLVLSERIAGESSVPARERMDKLQFFQEMEKIVKQNNIRIKLKEKGGEKMEVVPQWRGELPATLRKFGGLSP